MVRKVRPHHDEILLDGTAQSVRYGETLRDRSGRLDINSQEEVMIKCDVFSDSVLCLGMIHQNPDANEAWKKRIEWITTSQSYRDYDGISGEPTEFEWNIFTGFDTLQLHGEVKDLLSRLGETSENFTGRILFMSMFNDISCGTKDNEKNAWQMLKSSL